MHADIQLFSHAREFPGYSSRAQDLVITVPSLVGALGAPFPTTGNGPDRKSSGRMTENRYLYADVLRIWYQVGLFRLSSRNVELGDDESWVDRRNLMKKLIARSEYVASFLSHPTSSPPFLNTG
jgi:hypothetical protein